MRLTLPTCALLAALVTLSGCAMPPPPPEAKPHDLLNFVYRCDDGGRLRVTYDRTSDIAIVNELISLPHVQSGSGFMYKTDSHELQGKGDEVLWTAGKVPRVRCTVLGQTPSS